MKIFDGKASVAVLKKQLLAKVESIPAGNRLPKIAVILVGNSAASQLYVKSKMNICQEIGFLFEKIELEEAVSEEEILDIIGTLNRDETLDGYIVQLPLPAHIDENKILLHIDPSKDIDGFHPINLGLMMLGQETFIPATPKGILTIFKQEEIITAGKRCVILGRSNIVGTPMGILMSRKGIDATVTIAHSKSPDLKSLCLDADILIAAIGKPNFVKSDMVKEGAVVIDVGINRIPDPNNPSATKVVGDVDFDSVKTKCSFITPVPGGVGLLTVASILENTWLSYSKKLL